jgi:hypothetical protein
MMLIRWEYKIVSRANSDTDEAWLNSLGAERWELTGIMPGDSFTKFFFKRRCLVRPGCRNGTCRREKGVRST